MMALWHEDRSKIIYCRFYKSDLDRTVKSLEQKLLPSDELIDDNTARSLVTYFRNQCLVLREGDPNFFNVSGNGESKKKSKSDSSKQRQQQKQEQQQQPQQQKQEKEEEEEEDQQLQKKAIFVPRYTRDGLLAEAVVVCGRPMFAMAIPKVGKPGEVSITLQDAIDID